MRQPPLAQSSESLTVRVMCSMEPSNAFTSSNVSFAVLGQPAHRLHLPCLGAAVAPPYEGRSTCHLDTRPIDRGIPDKDKLDKVLGEVEEGANPLL